MISYKQQSVDRKEVREIDKRQEREQKKKWLNKYGSLVRAVKGIEEELKWLEAETTCPSGIQYSDMPKGCSQPDLSDLVGDFMDKKQELVEKLMKARYKRIQKYTEIHDVIEQLEDEEERYVLRMRYLQGKSWTDIYHKSNYEERQIYNLHAAALDKISINVAVHCS